MSKLSEHTEDLYKRQEYGLKLVAISSLEEELMGIRRKQEHLKYCIDLLKNGSPTNEVEMKLIEFLEEAACCFERCDTGGEDLAFWTDVNNARNCRRAANAHEALLRVLEAAKQLVAEIRAYSSPECDDEGAPGAQELKQLDTAIAAAEEALKQ